MKSSHFKQVASILKPNKCIMVGILLAEKALLKSPYVSVRHQGECVESFSSTHHNFNAKWMRIYS